MGQIYNARKSHLRQLVYLADLGSAVHNELHLPAPKAEELGISSGMHHLLYEPLVYSVLASPASSPLAS